MGRPTRSVTSKAVRPIIRVFTEGLRTEVQYLQAWHRIHRQDVFVDISKQHGTPMTLVDLAVADKQKMERQARRGKGAAPDEYWCVFDRDEHPLVTEAMALAAGEGINVAMSNPCLELWLLWHYCDHRRWEERGKVQHRLKELAGIDKRLEEETVSHLLDKFPEARARAQAQEDVHKGNGSELHENPSSGVWRVVDSIRQKSA